MIKTKRARKAISRKEVAHSPSDQATTFIEEKIAQARRLADSYVDREAKLDSDIYGIMQCAMELHDKFVFYGDLEEPLKEVLKREKIRITKNTTSSFIPLMKLVAPSLPSSTRGRSASILAYAEGNGTRAQDVAAFVQTKGGIVKCLRAANELKKPSRVQKRAEKDEAKLAALRENAKTFSAPILRDGLADGLWCCLIEKRSDKLRLLSVTPGRLGSSFQPIADDEFIDFE